MLRTFEVSRELMDNKKLKIKNGKIEKLNYKKTATAAERCPIQFGGDCTW